ELLQRRPDDQPSAWRPKVRSWIGFCSDGKCSYVKFAGWKRYPTALHGKCTASPLVRPTSSGKSVDVTDARKNGTPIVGNWFPANGRSIGFQRINVPHDFLGRAVLAK